MMPIQFEGSRWDEVADTYSKWWAGELKRPLIQMTLSGANDPGREQPALQGKGFTSHFPYDVPAEDIVDVWDFWASKEEYLGDAFPVRNVNFGPGVMAAFTGCELHNSEHTTWFHAAEEREARDISIQFTEDNVHYKRVCDIYGAAMERWGGDVQMSMTDLGGSLDVVSSFRPSERLLMDLYDDPESVKRLNWEVHECWFKYFDAINKILQPANRGHTCWTPIFSSEPYYMLQCDFCYMIGPDMFDEFVKPELTESCRKLKNAFYHLDGPGELPHLDSLLTIDELAGIQWVPGDGAPPCSEWPEIYGKIRDAGKRIQVLGGMKCFDAIAEQLGSAEGLYGSFHMPAEQRSTAEAFLSKYGVI
jgi:5-methyltetrahydrofolate--homocysteine methyltransferase